ncbi:MAG: TIGR02270 family protein [Deltaproteobacteria bacterium]|nr:TIGR02270 family protein [Deltaproteobacteria bacterium]
MPIIEKVIAQHAEEAAFLWLLRDAACREPHYRLKDLAKLDDRVEAHLDGLRIAGEEGLEVCKGVWAMEDAGEVFAASELAFEGSDPERIASVLGVAASAPELSRGAVSALGWLPWEQASAHVATLLGAGDAGLRRIGLGASVAHRRDPGDALVRALADGDLLLRARALRAVGELGRSDLLPDVRREVMAEDEGCRFAAAWSGALFGDLTAVAILKSFAGSPAFGERAVGLAVRRMPLEVAHRWLQDLLPSREHVRVALSGIGALGDPGSVPLLIELLPIPELARLAGEAFSTIAGADIAYEDLDGERPEGFEAGPTENPEDDDVAMDPDENLPWPDAGKIGLWWERNKGRFPRGTRHLLGRPVAEDGLQWVLRNGYQRQRAAAALELALRHPVQPLFETRAPGLRQKALLDPASVKH